MTALAIRNAASQGATCDNQACSRSGRRTVEIAGYPLRNPKTLATDDRLRLCIPCANEAEGIWAELSGDLS